MSKEKSEVEKELGIPEQQLGNVNILFLDPSSTCTGYALASVDFLNRKATVTKSGAIWFDKHWSNQDKYHYIFRALTVYFNIVGQIDFCIAEAYMINPKKKMGCMVGPELHGAIQTALAEIDIKYKSVAPQTWRSQLGIKPVVTGKGKDYKTPTKDLILQHVSLPEKIMSNISNTERKLPNDVTDALAIMMGFLKKVGVTNFDFSSMTVQEDFSSVMQD